MSFRQGEFPHNDSLRLSFIPMASILQCSQHQAPKLSQNPMLKAIGDTSIVPPVGGFSPRESGRMITTPTPGRLQKLDLAILDSNAPM